MTDKPDAAPAAAADAPSQKDIAAAQALLAAAAAAKPLPAAMAELCASPEFQAGLTKLQSTLALYPGEPSNDLSYAVLSMTRLVARYGG